ncbi:MULTISPECIES: DJ-1/PfpI family protein [unclassified Acidithiobacillus]|uniref:DJ-1/PfpI family protein n=1 Tax=unclassified Acidithiobacillus TaxID=2614800 RepID=UPI001D0D43E2|nr:MULTISPECIES: DJ-1/PfpI family protein [unclassified Acidithiobacillus]
MNLTVGFLVFPGLQLLDLAGAYEMFAALSDCEIHLFWKTRESVACSTGMRFYPTTTLDQGPPVDVLCIPGGAGINALLLDQEVQAWVQRQAMTAQFVTAVCTGALLLGTAGLLSGRRATTHWRYHDLLAELDAIPVRRLVIGQFSAEISVKIVHPRPDQYSGISYSSSASWGANFRDIVR